MTAPLVPREVDLSGLEYMPLMVGRVLDSDLFALSSGDEFKAAFALWCYAWRNRASIADDDLVLARHAKVNLATWAALKPMAVRGWILCDDGRLYHPTVAEAVLKAWIDRLLLRRRSAKGNAARYGQEVDEPEFERLLGRARAALAALTSDGAEIPESPKAEIKENNSKPEGGINPPVRTEKPSGVIRRGEERSPLENPNGFPSASDDRKSDDLEPNSVEFLFAKFEREKELEDGEAWAFAAGVLGRAGGLSDRRARSLIGKVIRDFGMSTHELAKAAAATWKSGSRSPEPYLRQVAQRLQLDRRPGAGADPDYWPIDAQRAWLEELKVRPASWRGERGPPPGSPGCRVDSALLVEYGFGSSIYKPDDLA